jgi:hypothetical protein
MRVLTQKKRVEKKEHNYLSRIDGTLSISASTKER